MPPAASAPRALFVQGNFIPESGAPESRLFDPADGPLSFTRLRRDVLETELGLRVDELVLTPAGSITPDRLAGAAVVVLGSNGRRLGGAEVTALSAYLGAGGSILTYADFQYGPDNWASDNDFLSQYGVEVFPDNFQPRTRITDILGQHPVLAGVRALEVEGISQFRMTPTAQASALILARCAPLTRPGCILQPAELARVLPGDAVGCVFVREFPGGGRLAGVCDRNLFHNGPQKDGTDLGQADNRAFVRNLFAWLTRR
ncbi:MAG: hypothetical protein ABIQ99_14355 [Thermoflexales bacterium]